MSENDYKEDQIRSVDEIARRAICVSAVTSVAYGDDERKVLEWLKEEGLSESLSPQELRFLSDDLFRAEKKVHYTWGLEQLVILLWAIGKTADLPPLTAQCDTEEIKRVVVWRPSSTKSFIDSAALRNEEDISEEYEKVYDAHWKVRDARLNQREVPDGLEPGVVHERHYAFNWVIGYCDQEWDEISTDT